MLSGGLTNSSYRRLLPTWNFEESLLRGLERIEGHSQQSHRQDIQFALREKISCGAVFRRLHTRSDQELCQCCGRNSTRRDRNSQLTYSLQPRRERVLDRDAQLQRPASP